MFHFVSRIERSKYMASFIRVFIEHYKETHGGAPKRINFAHGLYHLLQTEYFLKNPDYKFDKPAKRDLLNPDISNSTIREYLGNFALGAGYCLGVPVGIGIRLGFILLVAAALPSHC